MEGEPERVYKVALFGVTGSGKSSIINLLADKPIANVSTGVESCTKRAQWYPVSVGEKTFRLWDTTGFNQAQAKDINPLSPYEQAHAVLQNLHDGVDLILLCARKDGINASFRHLYWLLDSFFFHGCAQIALVLTHFDTPDEGWWYRNKHIIAQRCGVGVQFLPHACITTVRDGSPQSDHVYSQSKQALTALLQEHAASPTKLRLDLSSNDLCAKAVESLNESCQLNTVDAQKLVTYFKSQKKPFHAVLFGEAGAGKSSVINLVVGKPVAKVSSSLQNCTLDFGCYQINTGLHQFLVWDTVGFNGILDGNDASGMALENAARLIRDLHDKGGVDLLVFCKSGGRLSPSEIKTLTLFYEFFCDGQIPIAFIITHLETGNQMEKWWEANGESVLKACSLKTSAVAGHACITSAEDDPEDQRLRDKLSLSRQLVLTMFEDSITYGNSFAKPEEIWVMSFLKKLVKFGNRKLSVRSLMDRCGLSREQAEELMRSRHARA